MSSVNMTMRSNRDWSSNAKAQEFGDILVSEDDFLIPQKIDNREPERFIFDPDDMTKLIEIWTSETRWLNLKRRKPYLAWTSVQMWPGESKKFNDIKSGFDERYFKKEEKVVKLLSWAKRLYNWGSIAHGHICHEEDWNIKNYFGVPTIVTGGKLTSTGGLRLEENLPGIYWANFFSPIYVQFFGREKFRTVPAFHKEELPDGGYLLLTSPNPLDYGKPQVRALEQSIMEHLGREAFFEKNNPQKRHHAPQFTFEQAALGHPIEIIAYDPVSLAIPVVNRFIEEAQMLAESLVNNFNGKLDFSLESLRHVDDFILKESSIRPEILKNEEGKRLIKMLTAYYGEVLRRNLRGRWLILKGSGDILHPAVVIHLNKEEQVEYPFTRVYRLWSEQERSDGLVIHSNLLQSGQSIHLGQYLKRLLLKK